MKSRDIKTTEISSSDEEIQSVETPKKQTPSKNNVSRERAAKNTAKTVQSSDNNKLTESANVTEKEKQFTSSVHPEPVEGRQEPVLSSSKGSEGQAPQQKEVPQPREEFVRPVHNNNQH